MDDWTTDSLCCKDEERILQGNETLIVGLLLGSKTSTIVIDLYLPGKFD